MPAHSSYWPPPVLRRRGARRGFTSSPLSIALTSISPIPAYSPAPAAIAATLPGPHAPSTIRARLPPFRHPSHLNGRMLLCSCSCLLQSCYLADSLPRPVFCP
ncbi:hypothetical protein HYPSUDRAFT_303559 [Hypholoma sublateritium FD-334 SS-4]|uniref:Uncharacterized protein n=1 Tax=Hypholoma sublateritium (strain FD-334 SS-4) TaxID=945553 RepID=A0A0D2KNP7_HYPSF|nr:hypothetical protein HYPSUDRAFT_303559 [Hypholoma sublateritium FD-334 SS-4]